MKNLLILLCCFLTAQFSFAQSPDALYKKGDSLYKVKNYKNAAMAYSAGIKMQGKEADVSNYWRAASRWAMANVPDSAFYFLTILSKSPAISQGDANGIEGDKDFKSVQADKQWRPLMNKIMAQGTANYKVDELIYGRKDGIALTMLHIKPRMKSNGKSIIWVIAGSWFSSYQQAERTIRPSAMFLDKGFTVFLVILGSQPRYAIPDEIEDAKRAVRYIRYNAKQWQINPNQIGITGGSAGGHLSLAVAMADEKIDSAAQDPVNRMSSRVQAAAVLYPPTDCLNWGGAGLSFINNKNLQIANRIYGALDFTKWNELTTTYDHITDTSARNKIAREMSPIYYVSADDPPIFIIHGDADLTVPLQESQTFVARLKEAGVENKFIIKKGGVHNPATMMPEFLDFADWFDKNLK
ncbi:MAG: prolyl oligopeptidase family serine peptidase [Chitinophagaceae bacterium]|nr:prolyl oligopeptidase family serine peptidase [Chitinophagaceae bacterium]